MFGSYLEKLRLKKPLIHCVTNYVTVNDCANILLAAGAAPTMADSPEEMEEICSLADALSINIGTLSVSTVSAMFCALRQAKRIALPAVLDPVGAGASGFRTRTALDLLHEGTFSIVRGNISEMRSLAGLSFTSRGVDAAEEDAVTGQNLPAMLEVFSDFAKKHHCVAEVSGAISFVTDGKKSVVIRNGHPLMARVTGTGCMLTVLTAAFLAASPQTPLNAAAAALCAMGSAGEIAASRLMPGEGNASFRTRLIDAVFNMDSEILDAMEKYEIL